MKKTVHVYGCILGLLLTTSAWAQVPGRSRLELGRKNAVPATTLTASKPQRLLFPLARPFSPIDQLLTQGKNMAMRDYYRSILIAAPTSVTRATAIRSASSTEGATSTLASVDRPAGLGNRTDEQLFSNDRLTVSNIYPNPAHDLAEIDYQINGSLGGASITLLNIFGAPVADYVLDRSERKIRVQTRDLPTGYYFYQLSVEGVKVATKKLLVKHP